MALSSVDSKVLLVLDILQSEIITITNISNSMKYHNHHSLDKTTTTKWNHYLNENYCLKTNISKRKLSNTNTWAKPRWNNYLKSSNFFKKNIPSNKAKSGLPLVGTKGIFKGWVKGSSECGLRKGESV